MACSEAGTHGWGTCSSWCLGVVGTSWCLLQNFLSDLQIVLGSHLMFLGLLVFPLIMFPSGISQLCVKSKRCCKRIAVWTFNTSTVFDGSGQSGWMTKSPDNACWRAGVRVTCHVANSLQCQDQGHRPFSRSLSHMCFNLVGGACCGASQRGMVVPNVLK